MDFRLFLMIFFSSFIGVTLFENLYIEGLDLASSSVTSAMFNLVPALTFLMATILGFEQMKVKRLSNIAKMVGTTFCMGGAIAITFLKGQKLFTNSGQALLGTHNWLLGCLFLFAGVSCLSSWLILQVPITKRYPSYLFLSAWTCLFSMLQTGLIALFMERDPQAWGIFGTGAKYFIQCWCISRKGPLFVATFSPLSTVITTFFASAIFHEEIYSGSLLGAVGVAIGLYVFLWGKAQEMKEKKEVEPPITATSDNTSCIVDLEQPLLTDNSAP
ncbi:hypothetical protein Cgig2_023837 [Carnegiea gigantea]|uniref:WAT1-related protein n=1 Tax=Carnegiea gigantea TaxID=171969 RepID=A0A9Q1K8M2_9CARY|nr:hypothetical protein Cgig2_023837 [Carnegiea gigantea]